MNISSKRHLLRWFWISGLVILAFATRATAQVPFYAYNSFAAGNSYNQNLGWAVRGLAAGGYRGQAEWFIPGASGYLTSFQVALRTSSGSGMGNFYVLRDTSGFPGSV